MLSITKYLLLRWTALKYFLGPGQKGSIALRSEKVFMSVNGSVSCSKKRWAESENAAFLIKACIRSQQNAFQETLALLFFNLDEIFGSQVCGYGKAAKLSGTRFCCASRTKQLMPAEFDFIPLAAVLL